jgi:uncharacterized protein (TIGR03663 family)
MTERLLRRLRVAPAPRRIGIVPAPRVDRELVAYAGIAAVALVLRVISLGAKPMHHDEGIHGWFTWRLFTGEGYEYDPAYHGPVQFYLYTLSSFALGPGDIAMRAVPVVLGSALVVLPWFLRDQLGRVAALTAAALLAISPSFVYVARFAREDTPTVFLTLALIVMTFRFLDRPARWHPAAILGLLAASFATKETTYITVFVAGSFFIAALAFEAARARRRRRPLRDEPIVAALCAPGLAGWAWGLTSFALVFTFLFSTFLLHPQGLRDGLTDSLGYWLSQHPVERGSQPRFFYLTLIPAYELAIAALALVGVAESFRRPTLLRAFLVWQAVLGLAVFSWAGERMPWLVVHVLLPLALLAGIGAAALWRARGRPARVAATAGAVLAVLVSLHGLTAVAYRGHANPAELLVFTQTSVDVPPVRDRILERARRVHSATGEYPRMVVDAWGGTGWPWAWYLRDLPVAFFDLSGDFDPDRWDVVVVSEPNHARVAPLLGDEFEGRRFHLREWWVVDWGAAGPRDLWRWFWLREPWSELAALDQWLYVRTGRIASTARSG